MYGYYWEYTGAQIELLVLDCPIIVYDHKDKGKRNGKGLEGMPKADADVVNAKAKEWEEKYKKGKEVAIDFNSFFGSSE